MTLVQTWRRKRKTQVNHMTILPNNSSHVLLNALTEGKIFKIYF